MLKRWSIAEAPTQSDPRRYVLKVHAGLSDLRPLIRKFGAVCGRPKKDMNDPRYNLSLYLHGVTESLLGRIEAEVRALVASEEPAASVPPAPPQIKELPPIVVRARSVPPAPPPQPPKTSSAPPATAPLQLKPAAESSFLKTLAASPLCGASLDLDPVKAFEGMSIGVFNRFAHASSHAVVENPGHMYNPLLIFGPAGTGKTHLMNSIALKFKEQYPDQLVLMTSGPRLSVAVTLAVETRRMAELEEAVSAAKALIIDDIHLLEVSDLNRDGLSRLLQISLAASHQFVAASACPPRLLGSIEEALAFRFDSGYSVDLKLPSPEAQREIVARALTAAGIDASAVDREAFQNYVLPNFPELRIWVRRLMTLSELRARAGQSTVLQDVLAVLFPGAGQAPSAAGAEPPGGPEPYALFYPKGAEASAEGASRWLGAEAAKSGWEFPWSPILRQEYEPDPLTPFLLANHARGAGARAALILGPAPGTDFAGREQDFHQSLEHLLGYFYQGLGWVSLIQAPPSVGLLAYLDMAAALIGRRV